MLTGVIYGAIVVVWAAYLVPLALRRHDEASRTRSIARFSSAMRVLARRGATAGGTAPSNARVVLTPKPKNSGLITPDVDPTPAPQVERVLVTPTPNRAAERAAAARRRQVLSILVGLVALTGLLSALGRLPVWSCLVPLAMVFAFLVIARRSVRQVNEAYWVAAAAAPEPSPSVVVRRSAARVDASRSIDVDEPTVTLTAAERRQAAAAAVAEEHVVAVSLTTPEGGSLWDPLPVTLPTYVGAPVAKRTFRTIDLSEPKTWSSGHSAVDTETASATSDDRDNGAEDIPQVVNG